MKNYQELKEQVTNAFKGQPLIGYTGGAIDFSTGEIDLAEFINNIVNDILTITYDFIEDASETYHQVSYYSQKLKKTIILDADVAEQYATGDELINSIMSYQKESDRIEDSIIIYKKVSILCDNIDCKGNCENIEPVLMSAEFTGGVVNWCQKCREDNANFIDELPSDLAQKTLEYLQLEYGNDYEPLDGNDTELIAKVFLLELNKLMGNV